MFQQDNSKFMYFESSKDRPIIDKLPPGIYTANKTWMGISFDIHTLETDDLVDIGSPIIKDVLNDAVSFFSDKTIKKYGSMGFLHKRGILLHGAPGTGKSAILYQIMEGLEDTCVILNDPNMDGIEDTIKAARSGGANVVIVWEEFETMADLYEDEEDILLQVLDGANSVSNILFLCTTNQIDKISDRIKNRPSRIARKFEIGNPSATQRRKFLTHKANGELTTNQISEIVAKTDEFNIDKLKSVLLNVCCHDFKIDKLL